MLLHISKAFDKVWHHGPLYKLKCNGINSDLFKLIESFLSDRYQRVALNGQNLQVEKNYDWGSSRVCFFLIYISHLPSELCCSPKLFADDKSLFSVVKDVNETAKKLNKDLENISKWAHQWKMSFNPDPTKMVKEALFSRENLKEKLYSKLGLEYLKDRRCTRRLCLFHKTFNLKSPNSAR